MTNPTEETHYVSYGKFGRELCERLGIPKHRFPVNKLRNLLDFIGPEHFDIKITDKRVFIAASEKNFKRIEEKLPAWEEKAERRRQAFHSPIENHSKPYSQAVEWESRFKDYGQNFYQGRNR